MRLHSARAVIAGSALTALINSVEAQESAAPRTSVEAGLGVGTRVPHYGDEGLGPFASATIRVASGRSGRAFLLGVGYGIVFTDGWTSPDGIQYDFAPEAVMLHLGHEWPLGARRRFAIDAQWNPAVSRVRRWGPQPPWHAGSSPWESSASTASLGLRWRLPTGPGPVVGLGLRTYVSLWSAATLAQYGEVHPWYLVGVSVRPR